VVCKENGKEFLRCRQEVSIKARTRRSDGRGSGGVKTNLIKGRQALARRKIKPSHIGGRQSLLDMQGLR